MNNTLIVNFEVLFNLVNDVCTQMLCHLCNDNSDYKNLKVRKNISFTLENPCRKIMSAKLFVFALALASTQALSLRVQKVRAPDVSECMAGTSDWFSNIALNVQPWPVEIAAGKTITLDGAIDIMQEIEVGSGLNLKLTLITAIGNLPIPCLPVSI